MARKGFSWRSSFEWRRRPATETRPSRAMDFGKGPRYWTTCTDEVVFLGDLVVLSLPTCPAAVGRILGTAPSGLIHCVLVHGLNVLPGDSADVGETQLLAKATEDQLRASLSKVPDQTARPTK